MGYWEPHTSSIDFCEANYLLSPYVVEFHNTWSSIVGIALFGAIGLFYGNPTKEFRFTVSYTILILIGLGSACLHGTLDWKYQSSDELPMIYQILSFVYISMEQESPINEPKYPKLPLYLTITSIVNTLIYFTFQDFYAVFLATYSLALTAHVALIGQMFYSGNKVTQNPISRKICMITFGLYFLVASPIWVFDMLCCQFTLDHIANNLYGMTFHIIWHFLAGYGAYCTIVFFECFRMDSLQIKFHANYLLGFIPVVSSDFNSSCNSKATKND